MQALGEFIELGSMALAAGYWDVLEVYRAERIARAEHTRMGLLLPGSAGVASMAFVAGHSTLLVYRSRPTVGLNAHETVARKLGMASDTGIPGFVISRIRRRGEQEYAAEEEGANVNTIKP
jgi:hypothetical protein